MLNSFLPIVMTENTIVAFLQKFMSSSQHIYSIQPIIKHQPSKEFDLGDTFGFPNPSDCWGRDLNGEMILIVSAGRISLMTLDKGPFILTLISDLLQDQEFIICLSGHRNIEAVQQGFSIPQFRKGKFWILGILGQAWQGLGVDSSINQIIPKTYCITFVRNTQGYSLLTVFMLAVLGGGYPPRQILSMGNRET